MGQGRRNEKINNKCCCPVLKVNLVWDAWLRKYLPALTTRSKSQSRVRNLAINYLVLARSAVESCPWYRLQGETHN
jgi:hypothetical protein